MKVAVVILNWNGRNFLRQFLPSVISNSGDAEIIVADNASTDDSCEVLRKEFPSVKQIINRENFGFAGGYNEALKHVEADYFVLLNSDVEVTPDWISPVIKMMEKDKSIAACQPKILSHADHTSFEYAGAAGGFIDKYGYPFCRGRIFDSIEKDNGQYDDARQIFWATGACMFVRAAAFRNVNGFDASFFAHMEEIDLCWRMQSAGGAIWYCPESKVYHVGGGTLHKSNPHKTYLNFRNNLLMLYKNLSENEFKKVFIFRQVFDFLAAFKFLLRSGGIPEMKAVLRAHKDFRDMKKSLKPVQFENRITGERFSKVVYAKSILREYYLSGKKLFSRLNF
ncbi:MAG: glycosyltransferase family 2 protein [Bacteroidetes bacterium]|nr:glycosyltransferase family 2 protein [Bacteroidota bacterium]